MTDGWRTRLRSLPVFPANMLLWDPTESPADPLDLFGSWLETAIDGGVSQPHAMSLATVSVQGDPNVRTLLLKDVTPEGLWFASLASGPKGADLASNPRAAVSLYWREQGRQVRAAGPVQPGTRELATRDFLARHPDSRASAIVGRQSQPVSDPAELERALTVAKAQVAAEPDAVPLEWTVYLLRPHTVEFWQAMPGRDQARLRYTRVSDRWERTRLWP